MNIPSPLIDAAKSRRIVPFVGAGFSQVFSLPTWSELIGDVAKHIGFDPEIALLYGDFLQLAEFLYIKQNGLSAFRSELDKLFNSSMIDISKSGAHLLLPTLNASSIYTTNWDSLIERAFAHTGKDFNKITTFDDFVNASPDKTSIIKFHGDFSSDDKSLVFTESSYFERLDFESPLDIKLRSDMLGNTLLFLGYSFSDFNIRYMWFKLQKLLTAQRTTRRRDPFAYIVMAQRNPVFEEICKHSRDIGVIFLNGLDVQKSLIDFLKEISDHANS